MCVLHFQKKESVVMSENKKGDVAVLVCGQEVTCQWHMEVVIWLLESGLGRADGD